jgi:hypothetical protein
LYPAAPTGLRQCGGTHAGNSRFGRAQLSGWPMEQIFRGADGPLCDYPDYKLYCLGADGKITAADWIDAQSDEEAVAIARGINKSVDCEIWKGSRLVARVPAMKQRA